jgi:purine-nucleoside/S-methyl-5'-thioadenosine phosphorylase / adenosine deaminase
VSPFTSVAETPDRATPDLRILEHWKVYGVRAGLAGTAGGVDYRLPPKGHGLPSPWARLKAQLGFTAMVVSRQPHGGVVRVHGPETAPRILQGFDGHITRERGLCLAVTVADCIPVYLCHPGGPSIGIFHAGWRGVAAGIVEAGVRTMEEVSGHAAGDLIMHCGVGICGSCYEVGPEVWEAVEEPEPETNAPIDLRDVIARRAQGLGITLITVSPACTAHEGRGLQSHRRQGGLSGRMAAFIGIGEPCTRTETPVD